MENDFPLPRLGVSACLLGQNVRYDGGHRRDAFLYQVLSRFVQWVPVCPEVEAGMGVPRESVRLIGPGAKPKLIAQRSGHNWTAPMHSYAESKALGLARLGLCGYVFKKDSPSCGLYRVPIHTNGSRVARTGRGIFAAALSAALPTLPLEEEGRLNDSALRENFLERVFALHRWQVAQAAGRTRGRLVSFHTRHKFLLLAHSEYHYRRLGSLVAKVGSGSLRAHYATYERIFMEALAFRATAKKHSNVLEHMLGYFSDRLSPAERRELTEVIGDYRSSLVPLIAPLTLIRHYVDKYGVAYLSQQAYLAPCPKELMLRNYVSAQESNKFSERQAAAERGLAFHAR